jgi:hypothetical protein
VFRIASGLVVHGDQSEPHPLRPPQRGTAVKSFMKTLVVTAGALAAVTALAPAAQAAPAPPTPTAGTEVGGFFGASLNKLKDFIEASAPVLDTVSTAMGGPTYEGSEATAALNGITPMLNTVDDAAAPLASHFGFGGTEKD